MICNFTIIKQFICVWENRKILNVDEMLPHQSSRLSFSILSSVFCLHGVSGYVLSVSMWVSSRFSGFFPSPKNIPVGEMAKIICPWVWMSAWTCALRRTGIPSKVYSVPLHIQCSKDWPWPGLSGYWKWVRWDWKRKNLFEFFLNKIFQNFLVSPSGWFEWDYIW